MDLKTTVVKSKSSNGGVSSILEKQKSSKSNAEFRPFSMKKRGVYVENKDDNLIDTYENNDAKTKKKPPPRPRPGQKKFLSSVLNILSKSTTGTQYPDSENIRARKRTSKTQKIRNQETEANNDEYIKTKTKTKKPKYKSKILNGNSYVSFNDKFVVLQSRKDIIRTPSNFSENFPTSEATYPIREILENDIYSGVAEGLAKEILDGRSDTPVMNPDDPSTLVADPSRDDKKIYNFFVDLLETTFDVYNLETEQTKSKDSILEIEESVAKKLNFNIDTPEKEECYEHDHNLNFKIEQDKMYEPIYTNEKPKAKKKSPKRYSRSFEYSPPIPKFNKLVLKKKPHGKKSKKNELLNTIKEELKMDFMTYEEPENLFQALRIMAKYKKKCQGKKTIHFEQNDSNLKGECIFSRDIFSDKTITKHKNRKDRMKFERDLSVAKNFKPKKESSINVSNHSLKVYGIEYENDYDDQKYITSFSNISEVDDFDESFGISATTLDIKGFYSLLQE